MRPNNLFARPGTEFCSWMARVNPKSRAASPTGPEEYPPTQKTRLGLKFSRIKAD